MENHCCLSLSKCVNDKVGYKHRRLRRKSKMPNSHVASMVAMETNMLLFTKFRLISAKHSNASMCDIFNINLCEILNKN